MIPSSVDMRQVLARLQALPSLRCMDLQLLQEDHYLLVRATVASLQDRTRLLDTLTDILGGQKFSHIIHIDPLLNTPFSPTIPFNDMNHDASLSERAFLEGGQLLTAPTPTLETHPKYTQ